MDGIPAALRRFAQLARDVEVEDDDSEEFDADIAAYNPPNPYVKRTASVVPPHEARARAILGGRVGSANTRRNRANCYFCQAARINSGATACKFWVEMAHMFREDRIDTDEVISALNRAKKFETMAIQVNATLGPDEPHIPTVSAREIYDHDFHVKEATNRIENSVMVLQRAESTIEESMYELMVDANNEQRYTLNPAWVKPLIAVMREKRAWLKEVPTRMHLYAPDYDLNAASTGAWANMKRPLVVPNLPEVTKRSKSKRMKRVAAAGAAAPSGR